MLKNLLAAASVATCCLFNPAGVPPAEAAMQSCWMLYSSQRSTSPFPCDVSVRTNANGHRVVDIKHWQGNGADFSVVLWTDRAGTPSYAEIIYSGEVVSVPYYVDREGDVRLSVGDVEFIF